MARPRILLVTNVNSPYRDPGYRRLQATGRVEFIFYSDGGERYWGGETLPVDHLGTGLRGWWLGRTRITPGLIPRLVATDADVVIQGITGKVAVLATAAVSRARRQPLVLWTGVWRDPGGAVHRLGRPLVARLLRRADGVVTYGSHVSAAVVSKGVAPEAVTIVPQCVPNEHFGGPRPAAEIGRLRRSWGVGEGRVVLYVGRLVAEKGTDLLVDAFVRAIAERPEGERTDHLVIVGSGPLEDRLRSVAGRAGGERVHVVGRMPNAALPAAYQVADLVVVPSRETAVWCEPWGLVVNEAMAAGTCVLASDTVGAVRGALVRDGVSGAVFRSGDADDLAHRLGALLDDDERRHRLARQGHADVQAYTYDAMAGALLDAADRAWARHAESSRR
jgi:glycosyltransferase involved in cell wall biosynthesis